MVKVVGPLMSMDASGSLAKSMVFSKWKGRNYVRQLVTPSNPKTGGQVGVRAMFKFLAQNWTASVDAAYKATWEDRAADAIISPFNAFMSYNQNRWRQFNAPSEAYPALEDDATPSAALLAVEGAVRLVTCTLTYDMIRAGWCGIIHRSTTTPFTPTFATCKAVVLLEDTSPTVYLDTPLAAGTYYYRAQFGTTQGKLTPPGDHFEATVT